LTPDKPGPLTVDWPSDVPVELDATKKTPFTVLQQSGTTMPIEVVFLPLLAESPKEGLQLDGNRAQIKFAKAPKDHVYLLRLELVDTRNKHLALGSVLYMPDLKTGYNNPTTDANNEVFRELAGMQMLKSAKLTGLATEPPVPAPKK
jgi:hypothetical protein